MERQAFTAFGGAIEPSLNALLRDKTGFVMPVIVVSEEVGLVMGFNFFVGKGDLDVGEFGERTIGDEEGPTWVIRECKLYGSK